MSRPDVVAHLTGRELVRRPHGLRFGDFVYPARDELGRLVIVLDAGGTAEPLLALGEPGDDPRDLALQLFALAFATYTIDQQESTDDDLA